MSAGPAVQNTDWGNDFPKNLEGFSTARRSRRSLLAPNKSVELVWHTTDAMHAMRCTEIIDRLVCWLHIAPGTAPQHGGAAGTA